jgi:hypothetical protein
LSRGFPIQKCLKQGDELLPYGRSQKNQVYFKLNGTHQLLVSANDFNLLGEIISTSKKNTEAVVNASVEIGLEVNADKN